MRLIDADALLERHDAYYDRYECLVLRYAIEKSPTIDAVEIVRCKDCLHSRELNKYEKQLYLDECVGCTYHSLSYHDSIMTGDDFCSYGERRNADKSRDLSGYADKLREIKEGKAKKAEEKSNG